MAHVILLEHRQVWYSLTRLTPRLLPASSPPPPCLLLAYQLSVTERNRNMILPDNMGHNETIGNGTELRIMVPFADLFNHHSHVTKVRPGYHFNETTDHWEVLADLDYATGDEVFVVYMETSNADLLHHYNFIPRDNPFDTIALSLDAHFPMCQVCPSSSFLFVSPVWCMVVFGFRFSVFVWMVYLLRSIPEIDSSNLPI